MAEHLLAIDDVAEDFEDILTWAIEFKKMWKSGDDIALNFFPLADMAVGSIYEKPSTRTRVSFEVGSNRFTISWSDNLPMLRTCGCGRACC